MNTPVPGAAAASTTDAPADPSPRPSGRLVAFTGGERAVPFHCPYCGDDALRPHESVDATGAVSSPHGTWECRACLRAFSLRMLGLVRPVGGAR